MAIVNVFKNVAAQPHTLPEMLYRKIFGYGGRVNLRKSIPVTLKIDRAPDAHGPLVDAVLAGLEEARKTYEVSGMQAELLAMHGMSGQRYRIWINAIVRDVPNPRYLEIGSWAGSTLCSAIFGNQVRAVAIDNWSQFNGPASYFFRNLGRFIGKAEVSVLTSDFRDVRYDALGKHNVYLFDGPHSAQDHYDGLALTLPALDDQFVFIVDDWNWDDVREGTWRAIKGLGLKTKLAVELRTTSDNRHSGEAGLKVNQNSEWHNGYLVAVLSR